MTRIGIIGCGYVFDHYMATWARHPGLQIAGVADRDPARTEAVSKAYGLHVYPDVAAMLADPDVTLIVNLTSIESHDDVVRAALEAGKHVYSEKPLTMAMEENRALFALAAEKGLHLGCAPSNLLSDTSQSMWKAVRDGLVGTPRLIYAEFDDNPIYLMKPESWASRTGAPWPYLHEYEMGCTWEHVGYHLVWMLGIFGPVRSVTAFSKCTLPDKTDQKLRPADTPDFSVACLDFESGATGRVTCSIGAPYDHRMRIIGDKGMLEADTYRNYRCPVRYEHFDQLTLNARKALSVRVSTPLQRLFGIGGRKLKLSRNVPPGAPGHVGRDGGWSPKALIRRWKRWELGQQDKCVGVAEMADAIATGRAPFPGPDFILHVNELTLAIQGAGTRGAAHEMTTTFAPLEIPAETLRTAPDYRPLARPSWLGRLAEGVLERMHAH